MTADTVTSEEAIRRYLKFLENDGPIALDVSPEVAEARKAFALLPSGADPIEKLRRLQDVLDAENMAEACLIKGFVAVARAYGEEHGISMDTFRRMGVPESVLNEANLVEPDSADATSASAEEPEDFPSSGLTTMEIIRHIFSDAVPTQFTKPLLVEQLGGEIDGVGDEAGKARIRRVVDQLVSDERVKRVGVGTRPGKGGKPPIVYEKLPQN